LRLFEAELKEFYFFYLLQLLQTLLYQWFLLFQERAEASFCLDSFGTFLIKQKSTYRKFFFFFSFFPFVSTAKHS